MATTTLTPRPRDSRGIRSRHPSGVIAALLALLCGVVAVVSAGLLGKVDADTQRLYGRGLAQIPLDQLSPSVGVCLVVLSVAALGWVVALLFGILSVVRWRCYACGSVAVMLCIAAPAFVGLAWALGSAG